MLDSAIFTAADYSDALVSARRSKNAIVLLLLLMLLAQLTLFFLVRYHVMYSPTLATTQPSMNPQDVLHYFLGLTTFLGVALSIVLSFVLLLIVNIMLVGRLIGAGRLTSAYFWSLILLVLLFPWQSFLNSAGLTPDQATFKIPGVLCTWSELSHPTQGATFETTPFTLMAGLKWARFVAFPLLAVIILLAIQIKSNRGLRQAMGDAVEILPPNETI